MTIAIVVIIKCVKIAIEISLKPSKYTGGYSMKPRRKLPYLYPLRKCMSLHDCEICRKNITLGQKYYDGGYDNRYHKECVDDMFPIDNRGNESDH
jgi:hypothetical protein